MADDTRKEQVLAGVETFQQAVDDGFKYVVDTLVPQLMDERTKEEQLVFFETVDWDGLIAASPYLYQKLSKQALDLQRSMMRKQTVFLRALS